MARKSARREKLDAPHPRKPKSSTLSHADEQIIKAILLGPQDNYAKGIVCAEPWVAAVVAAVRAGRAVPKKTLGALYLSLRLAGVYPPADTGRHTLMRCCPNCGRDCPPTARVVIDEPGRQGALCYDCLEDVNHIEPTSRRAAFRPAAAANPVGEEEWRDRLATFLRGPNGEPVVKEMELMKGELADVDRQLRRHRSRERRMRVAESDAQLIELIEKYKIGEWSPEDAGGEDPYRREPRKCTQLNQCF